MSKVVRFPQWISASSASADKAASKKSDRDQFVSIALFSGIGLLVSLIAVLFGVAGVWS